MTHRRASLVKLLDLELHIFPNGATSWAEKGRDAERRETTVSMKIFASCTSFSKRRSVTCSRRA
jgi:hypothetical protein